MEETGDKAMAQILAFARSLVDSAFEFLEPAQNAGFGSAFHDFRKRRRQLQQFRLGERRRHSLIYHLDPRSACQLDELLMEA